MNGIDKIIAAIIDEAEREAEAIIAEAEESASVITSEHEARAGSVCGNIEARAEKEREAIVERAQSSGDLLRRNVLLEAKSEILDSVYEKAILALASQSDEKYLEMLLGIFKNTVKDQTENEKITKMHDAYGEYTVPAGYVIVLDRETDRRVGEQFFKKASDLIKPFGKELTRSDKCVDIKGGFILICGDVELACSIPALMSRVRDDTEAEVCRRLFA